MTDKKLQSLAKKWIKNLRLDPPLWEQIEVKFGTEEDLKGSLGACWWNIDYSAACILIATEEVHEEDGGGTVEETLVHELLHLRFEGHRHKEHGTPDDPPFERALNVVAGLLCSKKIKNAI